MVTTRDAPAAPAAPVQEELAKYIRSPTMTHEDYLATERMRMAVATWKYAELGQNRHLAAVDTNPEKWLAIGDALKNEAAESYRFIHNLKEAGWALVEFTGGGRQWLRLAFRIGREFKVSADGFLFVDALGYPEAREFYAPISVKELRDMSLPSHLSYLETVTHLRWPFEAEPEPEAETAVMAEAVEAVTQDPPRGDEKTDE